MNTKINTLKELKDRFQKGYEMIPAKFQKEIRLQIMLECDWATRATFINKQKGHTPIRKPEIPIIERIFAEYNIDAWTGEYLS